MNPKRFKEIRLNLGLTQEETAEILGVADKTTVNRYEAGTREPSKLAGAVMEILNALPGKRAEELMVLLRQQFEKSNRA